MLFILQVSLTNKVAGQIEGKVEDKRLGGVEDAAGAFFLRPLHGNVLATKEGIVPQDSHIRQADKCGNAVEDLAHARADVVAEVGPVEGQHAQFGETHAEIVEIVGGKGDLSILD